MLISPSISGTAGFLLCLGGSGGTGFTERYWQWPTRMPIVPRQVKSYSSSQSTSINPSRSVLTVCVRNLVAVSGVLWLYLNSIRQSCQQNFSGSPDYPKISTGRFLLSISMSPLLHPRQRTQRSKRRTRKSLPVILAITFIDLQRRRRLRALREYVDELYMPTGTRYDIRIY